MKRERTNEHDVLRQGSTVVIVERRSGVASSLIVPSNEAREALIRILSDPIEAATENVVVPVEVVEEKKTTTKKKTTKKSTTTTE